MKKKVITSFLHANLLLSGLETPGSAHGGFWQWKDVDAVLDIVRSLPLHLTCSQSH